MVSLAPPLSHRTTAKTAEIINNNRSAVHHVISELKVQLTFLQSHIETPDTDFFVVELPKFSDSQIPQILGEK